MIEIASALSRLTIALLLGTGIISISILVVGMALLHQRNKD